MTDNLSRAERARQAAEAEKNRVAAMEKKSADEAADSITVINGGTTASTASSLPSVPPPSAPTASAPPSPPPAAPPVRPATESRIDESADRPIAEKRKPDRQGIDLRPEDRDRVDEFELFCLKNRVRIGRKKGLTLYARAGFVLLEQLMKTDRARAEELLRSVGITK